jgi:hypothetical protein
MSSCSFKIRKYTIKNKSIKYCSTQFGSTLAGPCAKPDNLAHGWVHFGPSTHWIHRSQFLDWTIQTLPWLAHFGHRTLVKWRFVFLIKSTKRSKSCFHVIPCDSMWFHLYSNYMNLAWSCTWKLYRIWGYSKIEGDDLPPKDVHAFGCHVIRNSLTFEKKRIVEVS